jgi:hypothetical protein
MADLGGGRNLADLGKVMLASIPETGPGGVSCKSSGSSSTPARHLYPGDARLRGSPLVFGLRDLI